MAEKEELRKLKTLAKNGTLVIGKEETVKSLQTKDVEKIWLSSNVSAETLSDLSYYAKLKNVPIVNLSLPNDELGVLCKKQFFVSVACVIKGG